jgi:hypothetical protein
MTTLDMTLGQVRDLMEEGVIFGHSDFHCRALRGLEVAEAPDLACVETPDQFEAAAASRAGALLVPEALGGLDAHQLIVPDPRASLERLLVRLGRAPARPRPSREGNRP